MKIGRYILLALLLAGGAVFGFKKYRARRDSYNMKIAAAGGAILPTYDDSAFSTHAPDSVHITVEVINTTKVHGLGRKATTYLRDRGFDVMYVSTSKENRTQTLVLDRSGHPAWAASVAKAMRAHSVARPDTTRYLDVTVLLGSDWTPPPSPFYP